MVLIMLIRRSRVIAKVPRYDSISICFFKRTPHNHTTKALPCRNATHPSPFGNTFPSRARSSSKPHNLALLVGTTSHSSPSAPPSPFGARLTPLNLASLEELHLLSRLRRQLPRGEAFRLACFPIRHTWRLYDFYIRAFRFQGVPWPFSSAAAICTIKNHVER